MRPFLGRGGGAGVEGVIGVDIFGVVWDFAGGEEVFVGELGEIDFDVELFADGEEEIGGGDGLIGVVGEFCIEEGVGIAGEFGLVGVVFGDFGRYCGGDGFADVGGGAGEGGAFEFDRVS